MINTKQTSPSINLSGINLRARKNSLPFISGQGLCLTGDGRLEDGRNFSKSGKWQGREHHSFSEKSIMVLSPLVFYLSLSPSWILAPPPLLAVQGSLFERAAYCSQGVTVGSKLLFWYYNYKMGIFRYVLSSYLYVIQYKTDRRLPDT